MRNLIVISEKESQANHLAFLLGIPSTYILHYDSLEKLELIDKEAKGGFITMRAPYPNNVVSLRSQLFLQPISIGLIELKFDENGICDQLRSLYNSIDNYCRNYLYTSDYDKGRIIANLNNILNTYGLTQNKGFEFDVAMIGTSLRIIHRTDQMELLLLLLNKYR